MLPISFSKQVPPRCNGILTVPRDRIRKLQEHMLVVELLLHDVFTTLLIANINHFDTARKPCRISFTPFPPSDQYLELVHDEYVFFCLTAAQVMQCRAITTTIVITFTGLVCVAFLLPHSFHHSTVNANAYTHYVSSTDIAFN